MKYGGIYEFGSGKGIFRVRDLRGKTTEEIMKELAIPKGELEEGYVYVVIEIKTDKEPGIYEDLEELYESKSDWHWPYTGTGFISTRNGEILPEYYLYDGLKNKQGEFLEISAIKIKTADGQVLELGW